MHKIFISILSFLNIGNIVTILLGFPIASDMYASYGLTNQLPNGFVYLYNCKIVLWALLIFVIIFTLWYDIYFNKKRKSEKNELYKNVSIFAYITLGIILITTFFLFIFCILKPIMEVYMASFIFEANGI